MNIQDVQTEIGKYRPGKTWREIAALPCFQGVPAATLCAIYKHGRVPHNPAYLRILGLPVTAPAPVCRQCGQVHVTKRCTARVARPRVRRPSRRKLALDVLRIIYS